MHQHYFTVGPSALHHSVPDYIRRALREQIPSKSHRGKAFKGIYQAMTDNLRELLAIPSDYHVLVLGSATEAWERLLQNCVEDKSAHLVNGAFSARFAAAAKELNLNVEQIDAPWGSCCRPEDVTLSENVELLAICHNETSTGAMQPAADIAFLRAAYPDTLLAVDVVSSVPYLNFPLEIVDSCYFSVQKGMGLPAGLGIWIVNDRCLQKAEQKLAKGMSVGSYHSLSKLVAAARQYQNPETPNVLAMYLLAKVCGEMLQRGKELLKNDTLYKAAVLYQTLDTLPYLKPLVENPELRSKTTIVASLENAAQQQPLLHYLAEKGYILSTGYGNLKESCIRIANFPAHSREQLAHLTDLLLAYAP